MKDALPKLLFLFAIAALIFGYGFVSGAMQIFPYQVIKDARTAFSALRELEQAEDLAFENLEFWDDSGIQAPVYQDISAGAGSEDLFILGNDLTYPGPSEESSLLAWVADRKGNIKHAWKHPGEIWAPLENREAFGDSWRSYPIDAHLYDNGDILVAYQGTNVFPIAMGLAKFDKDSNLLWKRNGLYHHWFSIDANGDIFIPGTTILESPVKVSDRQKRILCSDTQIAFDTIAILDQNGDVKKEINLLKAFVESDLSFVFNNSGAVPVDLQSCDPMHLNDVQVLSEEVATRFPSWAAGDLLLSFRSLNAVGVLDPQTEKFKWFHAGTTQHQHSPRYSGNNQVLVFDNYGGKSSEGTTRVVSIDAGSGLSDTVFPRPGAAYPERDILSRTAGYLDVHPADDRVLVAFSKQGLVWEIDITSGEVLWEFVNTHQIGAKPGRVSVFSAQYIDSSPSFTMNGGDL